MSIQWFPGHMNAARKKAADTLARTDLVIEVLDARAPEASSNPMIRQLREFRQRPCLRLLNKADLADVAVTAQWLAWYNGQPGVTAFAISCKKPGDVARVPAMCRKLAPHRNDGTKPLRMMIMGIPNVGKSTLMNALLKKRVARVGDEPAVTRMQQRFDFGDNMTIVDTPGLMWPKIEHDRDGFCLAACHAIGRNAVIDEDVALFLGKYLLQHYPVLLQKRYQADAAMFDAEALLAHIGQRRGCIGRGGVMDTEKAAQIFLQDFRDGLLGCISLESPAGRQQMLEDAALSVEDNRECGAGA